MRIKLYNQSGKPVDIESAKNYEESFKKNYDLLWDSYEKKDITLDDFKVELDKVDKMLAKKHPMYEVVDLPTSGKQWKNLSIKYGYPVVVAITQEKNELVLFLMDGAYN